MKGIRKIHPYAYKTERNIQVYEMYMAHPEMSLQHIALQFGVTRQRIRVIVQVERRRYPHRRQHGQIQPG